MTEKRGHGTKTFVESRFNFTGDVIKAPPAYEAVPLRRVSFTLGDWHVESGWPVPGAGDPREVVAYDITPDVVTYPQPEEIETNADGRWIGSGFTGSSWPAFSGYGTWSGTGTKIDNYKYISDEISYSVPGVRLDPDEQDYLTADLTAISGDTYSVIMVFKPYPSDSDADESDDDATYGLWAPATPGTGQPELRVKNDKIFMKQSSELAPKEMWKPSGTQRSFTYYLRRQSPTYLAFMAGPERFFVYLGTGPSTMERYRLHDVRDLAKIFNFRLGSYATDTTHTANVTLFDVNFYNQGLTATQMLAEVELLSAAYGGYV